MTLTASSIQAGFEPIPGYVLRDKLGVGGYGEVWLADAPGGLKKAIKFVHGNVDGDRAASELKSLQRIRQVNHPFILSLERIEVIEGQLIIVTELAQGSLHDRYVECREKGFVGIMRDRLLDYLRDAADGLDFLCQQHDLQHLDIKPANLLLVADRIKVADFGLIKDIQTNSLSMMAGLTPTYAAPEMFDGRPGRFSDQYSLAIVYQEMLTGTLPFRGRTTAQLANEHLHKAPNLEAIPLLERPILSKALSKKPQMRFSDCREFIDALRRSHLQTQNESTTAPAGHAPRSRTSTRSLAAKGNSHAHQQPKRSKLAPTPLALIQSKPSAVTHEARQIDLLPALPSYLDTAHRALEEPLSTVQENQAKSITIGIGGTGVSAILGMRQAMAEFKPELLESEHAGFLVFDTDEVVLTRAMSEDLPWHLPYDAVVHMPLKSPQYYRENTQSSIPQLSRRWVYNIPRSLKTEGVRPLGVLAFIDHLDLLFETIHDSILKVVASQGSEHQSDPIAVRIVASSHGGTGSAVVSEVGFLLRQLAAELELDITIELLLTCATPSGQSATDLPTASSLACLMEIHHYFQTEGLHPPIGHLPPSQAINQPPFDHVTLFYGGQQGSSHDWDVVTKQVADYLWTSTETDFGNRILHLRSDELEQMEKQTDASWTPWLSTACVRHFEIGMELQPELVASRTCLRLVSPWMTAFQHLIQHRNAAESQTPTDAKTLEHMDFFVSDLFRTNRWTAQAWVRECMECIVQVQDLDEMQVGEALAAKAASSNASEGGLNFDQRQELEQVCEQLAISSELANRRIVELFTKTRNTVATSLLNRWLLAPAAWQHLKQVLRLIANKFSVNTNSLFVVAQKLGEKHDALLEQMYAGELKASPELEQQLHTIALEAHFHSMAARMLARMADHMAYLEDLWFNECILINREFQDWGQQLANQLGIRLDETLFANSVLSALPSEGDSGMAKEIRHAFLAFVTQRFVEKPELPDAVENNTKQEELNEATSDEAKETKSDDQAAPTTLQSILEMVCNRLISSRMNEGTHAAFNADELLLSGSGESPSTSPLTEPTQQRLPTTAATAVQGGVSCHADAQTLEKEIASARPYFVEFGGGVRNMVVLPSLILDQLDSFQKATLDQKQVATIISPDPKRNLVLCVGERITLSDIVERVWMPSSEVWNLAHRILSRVDIDWLPINV